MYIECRDAVSKSSLHQLIAYRSYRYQLEFDATIMRTRDICDGAVRGLWSRRTCRIYIEIDWWSSTGTFRHMRCAHLFPDRPWSGVLPVALSKCIISEPMLMRKICSSFPAFRANVSEQPARTLSSSSSSLWNKCCRQCIQVEECGWLKSYAAYIVTDAMKSLCWDYSNFRLCGESVH